MGISRRSDQRRRSPTPVTLLAGVVLLFGSLQAQSTPRPALAPELEKVRTVLDKYQDPIVAIHDGYFSTLACVEFPSAGSPGQVAYRPGGMGVHFLNMALVGPNVDPLRPQVLLYEAQGSRLHLVAAEWFVPLATGVKERPHLFGQPFEGPMEGHHPLQPMTLHHYDLHAWLWKKNPSGMFSATNPVIECPTTGYSLREQAPNLVAHHWPQGGSANRDRIRRPGGGVMNTGKDMILVTGATGQQGGAVARELLARKHRVRAMTRKPDSQPAQALARLGAEVVKGDLNDPSSLQRALRGAWGVFAVQNTWEAGVEQEETQGKRIAELAKQSGVRHFVYTSVGSAHRKTGIPHFDNKWRVEETVRKLGFPSQVIIRPVFFMENFASPWFKPGIDQGKLMIALQPTTVLQMIAVADIGKYGLLAFEKHEELNRQEIDLAGDQHTMPDTAKILSKAAGRTITFQQVPIAEVRKLSEDYAIMLEWFDRVGYNVDIAGNAKQYGIKPTKLADWAARVRWG